MLCKNCKYYNKDDEKLEKGTGRCIVFQPVIVDAKIGCFYPVVSEDSFCMYFTPATGAEIRSRPTSGVVSDIHAKTANRISPVVRRKK